MMIPSTVMVLVLAQAPTQAPPATQPAARPAVAPAPPETRPAGTAGKDYRVGPGDILGITVYGHEDLNLTVVVQSAGSFAFPLIGSVPAAGATTQEVEARIASRLAKGLIRDAQVTVVVQEYRSKVVFVVGEVSRPGPYPLAGETTVVELLSRAGPLSPNAGTEVVGVRPSARLDRPVLPQEVKAAASPGTSAPASAAQVLRVDVRAIQSGHLDKNLALEPGDTLFVPQAARIFVTGEVRNPGAFAFTSGITARQAISLAGGFTEDASKGSARVVRQVAGKPQTVKIKLDEPIQPGDTVLVKATLF
jgi:polysaccharide export outer membrane protein